VVDQKGKPVFEVQYKEKTQYFTADQIAETIYRKVLGQWHPFILV
jgi:hypothetical protein